MALASLGFGEIKAADSCLGGLAVTIPQTLLGGPGLMTAEATCYLVKE